MKDYHEWCFNIRRREYCTPHMSKRTHMLLKYYIYRYLKPTVKTRKFMDFNMRRRFRFKVMRW